ncbi:hypothetical protein [Roseivivax sp. CAU 1761]
MRPAAALCLGLALAGCGGLGGGAGVETAPGVRQIGDTTIVEDTEGAALVIDGNGCQTVVPASGGPAELVRDADGRPVCAGPDAARGG